MSINNINLTSLAPNADALTNSLVDRANSKTSSSSPSSFGSALNQAVNSLDQQQQVANQEIARAVTGESPDLHQTITTLQLTDLNFQFALQVRNKVIGAYEEIMRMQV